MSNTEERNYIFGIRAIIEAVNAGKTIDKLFIQKGLHNDLFAELWKLVRLKRINYKHVPLEKINRLTRKNHQGVFAFISPIDFHNIEDVVPALYEQGKNPLILVLDRITDVRNFGAIARTAECAGVDAIIIPEQNAAAINADAIKTSAGAIFKIPICKVDHIKDAIFYLKASDIITIAATEKTNETIYDLSLNKPVAIIMGSEESGITQDLINLADISCKIPMKGAISSLNVGVATGMVLYEKIRQELVG